MTSTPLAWTAATYAEIGWHVFPCEPRGKRPHARLARGGLYDATTTLKVVRAWWRADPHANIGLRCGTESGVVVLDIDGEHGTASILDLQRRHGAGIDARLRASTPRGGWHAYYRHPGETVRNTAGRLGVGLDTRGDGGYVVAPPSIGANGNTYRWLEPVKVPGPIPAWLLELLRPPEPPPTPSPAQQPVEVDADAYARAALEGECERVATAPRGRRNNTLNEAAFRIGSLVAAGALREHDAIRALFGAAEQAGLGKTETVKTVMSGLGAGKRHPRDLAVRA